MFKNYFLIAWRNLRKSKAFSVINIAGLALGLTCSILIFLWVRDEYNVDSFYKDRERIYVVTSREFADNEVTGSYDTPGMLGEELKRVMPDVAFSCNYSFNQYQTFSNADKKMKMEGVYAGADFFNIFSYALLQGTPATALSQPESIAISEKMAINFFGSAAAAMHQALKLDNYKPLQVTAVFKDLPSNASQHFEYLLSWQLFIEREPWVTDWHNSGPFTFVQLRKNADPVKVANALQHFIKKYDSKYTEQDKLELGLQRYDQKYLFSNFKNGYTAGGRIEYVRLFSIVAIFVLLIACINFMNLATARSLKRAKEIGVRKVIGALRSSLIQQFLGEAIFLVATAVLLAVAAVLVLLPAFNLLTGKTILSPAGDYRFWFGIVGLTLVTGCIAGSYPALLLSSFKPIAVLKNTLKLSPLSMSLRKGLVVFQFTISILFITSMIIISRQVDYLQTKNLGYQKENLIYMPVSGDLQRTFTLFKNDALKVPGIVTISSMSNRPVQIENTTGGVEWDGKAINTHPNFTQVAVGYDFVKTMNAAMLSGRDFSPAFADSGNYIINETALRLIGYKQPIGASLSFWGTKGMIIGVVKDFHFNSLHVPIMPLVIRLTKQQSAGMALIRTAPGKTAASLAALEKLHQQYNPAFPFSHQFADEEYGFLYKSEMLVQKLSKYFAFLAIFISGLGLLGLVLFTAEQRTREIGIRKVLGASVGSLFTLLSKDFLLLVLLAFVIATPVSWWAMNSWLNNFSYRSPVGWTVFAAAGAGAIVIALLTIAYQALKTAMANPVTSLRNE